MASTTDHLADGVPSLEEEIISPSSGLRRRKNNDPSANMRAARTTQQSSKPQLQPTSTTPLGDDSVGITDSIIGGMRPSQVDASDHRLAISTIDKHFRYFAVWNICTYIALVSIVYAVVPSENIVHLEGVEQRSAIMAMSLIAVSFFSRVLPLIGGITADGFKKKTHISGIFIGGLTVQIVAFCTDFLMGFFPVPVVIDPVLGTRVHVLRWCEWCPCATFMTFMMEGADMYWSGDAPPPNYLRLKYLHACTQGGAVFLGLLFPFCPGFKSWMFAMILACGLYLTNYPRMWSRQRAIPSTLRSGATVEEAERFNAARIALRLRMFTTCVWSIIVGLYFVSSVFGPMYAPEGSLLRNPAANMICECFFDVLSKVLFLVVIMDVHKAIFDPSARVERRLNELRQLMSAVWGSSCDVIAITVRTRSQEGTSGASVLLSPAFFGLTSKRKKPRSADISFQKKSVLYQLSRKAFEMEIKGGTEGNEPIVNGDMISHIEETGLDIIDTNARVMFDKGQLKPDINALRALSDVVVKAWACTEKEKVFTHDLSWTGDSRDFLIRSEAKVSRLDDDALIVIVRDISERVRVFEAEKQILFETTSRQKDAEANRFTRHEVKNGLLAALGLYESLCDAQSRQLTDTKRNTHSDGIAYDLGGGAVDSADDVIRCLNELGKSLHETLDSVLVEAMTRDLIHNLYRPHREKCDVATVLSGGVFEGQFFDGGGNHTRFPLITRPSPLPKFYFDHQLLRYLHRQALSNACKYGKTGGVVLTEVTYDEKNMTLQINVINLPGEHYEKILAMGTKAEEMVFSKSEQIHEQFRSDADSTLSKKSEVAALPGDGGWIMAKCAKIMKGTCSIKFEETKTVFSLDVPAKPYGSMKIKTPIDIKTFKLPAGIWGIAIDDSKIQMKLLGKFYEFAGIPTERVFIFGKNADEIMGFVDFVVDFMDKNAGDHVLLIADENLDVMDEASKHRTISGSQLVENIRLRLLPEQEKLLVALIRSANDSSSDVAIYNSRAHGFLPKAPIKKGNVLETLAPLWMARYPQEVGIEDDSLSRRSHKSRSDSFSSLESSSSLNEAVASTPVEINQTVNEISELFSNANILEDHILGQRIWEKLHALKGDLLTLQVGSKVITAVGMINSFRDAQSNEDLVERWTLLRDQISTFS